MLAQKAAVLGRIPFFGGLSAPEIQAIAERAVEKRYPAGTPLFHEGEECQGMFIIGAGQVKIFKTSSSGREMTIAVETAPSTVAELPLFDGGPYPRSWRSTTSLRWCSTSASSLRSAANTPT